MKFATDSTVRLTVIDPNSFANTLIKTISVQRKKTETVVEDATLFAKIDLQTKITNNKRLTDSGIICALGRAEKCSLNFTGENSVG